MLRPILLLALILTGLNFAVDTLVAQNLLERKRLDPKPYMMPSSHPLQQVVAQLFPNELVLQNEASFHAAGFITLYKQRSRRGSMRLARHPLAPGYLFKLYLESEKNSRIQEQNKLVQRCISAEKIREFIRKKNFRYFAVASKWLYKVPAASNEKEPILILVVQDMKITNPRETAAAWKTKITKAHLLELYAILKTGYASTSIIKNIPYTKTHLFAFVDTEFAPRNYNLFKVGDVLSKKMQKEWNKILMSDNY